MSDTNASHPDPANAAGDLTIAAFQRHIRERYYKSDAARGTPGTFMWLIEEIGELATALHNIAKVGEKDDDGNDKVDDATAKAYRENLDEEFADVFAWLFTLANVNGVDISEAIRQKYLTGEGPEGTK